MVGTTTICHSRHPVVQQHRTAPQAIEMQFQRYNVCFVMFRTIRAPERIHAQSMEIRIVIFVFPPTLSFELY